MDTSRHSIHQKTIHWTRYTPQTTMNTMRSAETGDPYNRHIGYHKDTWTMQTPGHHTTDNMPNTRHIGRHGQWIQEGTIRQTLWTPPGTVDTMVGVSVRVRVRVRLWLRVRVMVRVSLTLTLSLTQPLTLTIVSTVPGGVQSVRFSFRVSQSQCLCKCHHKCNCKM